MQDILQSITQCEGNIFIDQNDRNIQMLLAWLLYVNDVTRKKIYTINKKKMSGLWTKVYTSDVMEQDDLLLLSSDSGCEIDDKCMIIDILQLITHKDVSDLEHSIEKGYEEAYKQIDGSVDLYFEQVSYMPNLYYKDDLLTNRDYNSDNVNIIDGLRFTCTGTNIDSYTTLHFFGDSRMYGLYVGDEYTIPSLVSKKTHKKCINYGTHGTSIFDIRLQIRSANIKAGDVVIINNGFIKAKRKIEQKIINATVIDEINKIYEECERMDVKLILCIFPECGDKRVLSNQELNICIFQEFQRIETANSNYFSLSAEWKQLIPVLRKNGIVCCDLISCIQYAEGIQAFVDYIHFGTVGNEFFSDILSEYITQVIKDYKAIGEFKEQINALRDDYRKIICERRSYKNSGFFDEDKFNQYIDFLRKKVINNSTEAAVIVMNANPFTYGHQYIIEESLKRVQYLYILVVQEKHTVIPFEDRLELIKQGTSHMKHITIIPSSEFVVSNVTLPEYFKKEKKQCIEVDASRDIDLFINYIMPALGVQTRIAGEEPYCSVTREYNRQIAEKFNEKGLSFIQIERKKQDDTYISASKVRRAVYDGKIESIQDIVPSSTYDYLLQNFEMIKARMSSLEVI